jgi:toxin ParE1/3/4
VKRAVRVQAAAAQDLGSILAHISQDSPESAERFPDAFQFTLAAIAEYPLLGHPVRTRASMLKGLRRRAVIGFRSYLVFYLVPATGPVLVLRVLHGAMNIGPRLRNFDLDSSEG